MYRHGSRGSTSTSSSASGFKPPAFLRKVEERAREQRDCDVTGSGMGAKRKSGSDDEDEVNEKAATWARGAVYKTRREAAPVASTSRSTLVPSQSMVSTPPAHNTPSAGSEEYYMCTWRRPQARKHKTWDGDGILIVNRPRKSAKLKCLETGKELAVTANFQLEKLDEAEEMSIAGKEVEVDRRISHRDFLSYLPTGGTPARKAKTASSSTPIKPSPSSAADSLARRAQLMAPAPAASFYAKPLPKPLPRKSTSENNRMSPEVSRALDPEKENRASTPIDHRAGPSRPGGLFNRDAEAAPRYDPSAKGAIIMRRPNPEHQAKYNKRGLPLVDVVINPILSEALRPHQIDGVKFLYDRVTGMEDISGSKGAILADEMGLGKTLQTITLLETLLRQSPYYSHKPCVIEKALVVCPLSLVKNWTREFRKWIGSTTLGVVGVDGSKGKEIAQRFVTSKRDQVLIIGYEKLRSVVDILSTSQPPIGIIVCDEGHRLKSKETKTNQIFSKFSTSRRVILTGTPIQNDLSELYAMIDFVCPGLLSDYHTFKSLFEDPIVKSRVQHASKEVKMLGQNRSTTLASVTNLVVLRRTADILDGFLLPKNENIVFCKPSELQLKLYRHVLKSTEVRALTNGASAGGSALPLITILRQICDSPELLLKDALAPGGTKETLARDVLRDAVHLFPSRKVTGDEELSGKLKTISRLLDTIKKTTDDKCVLVSTFTSTLDVLESFCKRKRYSYVRLDGTTKQSDRLDLVNNFNRSPPSSSFIFLLSTRAGGVGLNLIGANRLFLMEPEWNPALDQQAMARIHRDGQRKICFIYRMMSAGAMDEKILQRQVNKLGLSETLMGGKDSDKSKQKKKKAAHSSASKGASGGKGDSFTAEELKDIFTLHEDTSCLCHDQLLCHCGGLGLLPSEDVSGSDAHDKDSDSDDDDFRTTFIPASQQASRAERERVREARARLAGLGEDWRHLDTSRVAALSAEGSDDGHGEGEETREMVLSRTLRDDAVLRKVILDQAQREKEAGTQLREEEEDGDIGIDIDMDIEDGIETASASTSASLSPSTDPALISTITGDFKKASSLLDTTDLSTLEASLRPRPSSAVPHGTGTGTSSNSAIGKVSNGNVASATRVMARTGDVLFVFTKRSGAGVDGIVEEDEEDEEEAEEAEGEGEGEVV